MRILYHHRTLGDGAEGVHIEQMVRAFRGLGHEVRLLCVASSAESGGAPGRVARVKAAMPRAAFEAASVAVNMPEYVAARRAIREFRPDLVYKRHARYDVGTSRAASHCRVPLVLEVNAVFSAPLYHQFEPLAFPALSRSFERRALRSAAVVLAVSTPLARQIDAVSGVDAVVIPNGADPDSFAPETADATSVRTRYGLGTSFTIGWTGVLRDWHGLELLLEALACIEHARLLIVGDGPAQPAIEARAVELGVGERVCITGRIAHTAMPDHIAAMDVCVVADERTGVASPMKLLEYMAMARAVVAPDMENIRDVLTTETEGLLFRPGDSGALAEALRRLAGDAELRERLGSRARAQIVEGRNWRTNARAVLDLAAAAQGLDGPGQRSRLC